MKEKSRNTKDSFSQEDLSAEESKELLFRQKTTWSLYLLWAVMGSILFAFIYACFARIDEIVIARGELQAKGGERLIKAPFNGLISQIFVKEGQKVKFGQKLIQINSEIFDSQKEALEAEINGLESSLKFEKQIISRLSPLVKEGVVSTLEYLNQKNSIQKIESAISSSGAQLKEINVGIFNSSLTSPVNGYVFNLVPASAGYFVTSGETLLRVVPEGPLEAKVFLTNQNIGLVRPSMKAEIRIDAYPYTQFGTLRGTIESIGQEVLPADQENPFPRFPAYVKLNQQFLEQESKRYKLGSGQSVTVNLIVRDKPVISILTNVLGKSFDSLRKIKSD